MKNTKIMVAVVAGLLGLGIISHTVEDNINQQEVKDYVTENFKEQDDDDVKEDFDNRDESFLEKIGF